MSENKIPLVQLSDQPSPDSGPVEQWPPAGVEEHSESRREFVKDTATISTAALLGTAALLTGSDKAEANASWAEHFQG
ncbi:MAG: hypothetical protein DRQ97_07790, partial [Gammaproteobacteria bacterium]